MVIIDILLIAVISSVATLFWIFCIGAPDGKETFTKERILSFIGKRINEWHSHQDYKIKESKNPLTPNIFKIFGVCYICTNFWFTIMISCILIPIFGISFWWLPIISLLSHLSVSLLYHVLPTE